MTIDPTSFVDNSGIMQAALASTDESDDGSIEEAKNAMIKHYQNVLGTEYEGSTQVLKYPEDIRINADTDYMSFQFHEYKPPFDRGSEGIAGYNQQSAEAGGIDGNLGKRIGQPIHLFMPQDVSTSYGADWGGKEVSNLGAGTLSGLTNVGTGNMMGLVENVGAGMSGLQALPVTLGAEVARRVLQSAGTNLTINDILGGTRGTILNPNVELFFSGPRIRNVGFKFKMSARTPTEAEMIHLICHQFKINSVPQHGGKPNAFAKAEGLEVGVGNFIKIPNLVAVRFMQGSAPHPFLSQYKACALTNVDINYTPDGSYSTFSNGYPTAVELSIALVETKMVFQQDLNPTQERSWSY